MSVKKQSFLRKKKKKTDTMVVSAMTTAHGNGYLKNFKPSHSFPALYQEEKKKIICDLSTTS